MLNTLYSTMEAAEAIGVSRITIFYWIKNKNIKAKKFGRNYLIEKKEIDRINENMYIPNLQKAKLIEFAKMFCKDYSNFINSL